MISPDFIENDALAIGAQIRAGRTTARDVMRRTFARIRRVDAGIGAFTRLWLGVRPATGLTITDQLAGPPEILTALDVAFRLPPPLSDWPY